jgi:alanine racemase
MTLRLTVDGARWRHHVDAVHAAVSHAGELVPVVKGNGYGFGRARLVAETASRASLVAVGTMHEVVGLPCADGQRLLVLTPPNAPVPGGLDHVVVTVGSPEQVTHAAAHTGPIAVKLRSSMQRYGATPDELPEVLDALDRIDRRPECLVLHLPLLGPHRTDATQLAEIEAWLPALPDGVALSVSHVSTDAFASLAAAHPERRWQYRTGTELWHGDKSFLHLGADVVEVRRVHAGDVVGYRGTPVPDDGWLVLVGAGSAHGVTPLPDGRSPFHHDRRRLVLLEPPHMHTSMCIVPLDQRPPSPGEWVDVQRPLIAVLPDEVVGG